jgi:hypothetical protein
MCIFTFFTGQQNLTFFLAHGVTYLFLVELLTLNSITYNFVCDSQVKCAVLERHTVRLSRMPSAMNQRLSHSLPASEHIQLVI